MRIFVTHGPRSASLLLLMVWCSTVAVFPQSTPPSDPREGTIHPLLKWSSPEVIAETMEEPKYPLSAKKGGVGAELILLVQIDETGSVTSVEVTRTRRVDPETCQPQGKPGEEEASWLTQKNREALAAAAAEAILGWKYHPATRNGKAITSLTIVVVRFCPKGKVMILR
ncbi:MAG: energy transducer TonB [Acidobacteria bacterium]|nr:energy transducer TonB [Acidobacteriota bacterium]